MYYYVLKQLKMKVLKLMVVKHQKKGKMIKRDRSEEVRVCPNPKRRKEGQRKFALVLHQEGGKGLR